jgi:hypothetical protein
VACHLNVRWAQLPGFLSTKTCRTGSLIRTKQASSMAIALIGRIKHIQHLYHAYIPFLRPGENAVNVD